MDSRDAVNRDLLVGILALQNGLIDQDGLVNAFRAWTRDKSRPFAEILSERDAIDSDDRGLLEALAARHLKRHGGDAERSLGALTAGPSARLALAELDDPGLEATLAHIGTDATLVIADRAVARHPSAAASDGQRFRVLRPHAQGGLGAVFVALDEELHREVALKRILDRHADDPASRTRFVLEAEITGGLEHPGIVPVYGLGSHDDGRPYYAMRFIRGDSLKAAIAAFHADESLKADPSARSLALRTLLRRFGDVCNAIEYAHTRGVVHRDIKPANVIVGKHGETLVVDWGLAKLMGKSESGATSDERTLAPSSASGSSETMPGSAVGTPSYMSPEQAVGNLDQISPRSDVYGLGATLYCLLTGKPPYDGDAIAVLRAVQRGEFPAPRALDASIDRALEAVCLKAMATNPNDRYATPAALAEDVERWMADERVTAWREPRVRTLLRWLTRHRMGVAAAAAFGLAALTGLAAVGAVQARANHHLAKSNNDLFIANLREAAANSRLTDANQRVQTRFELALEAVKTFHTGVSEDFLLKERHFGKLRKNLLGRAADFYGKLGTLLKSQEDAASRAALAGAYEELAVLTRTTGSAKKALELSQQAVALQRESAARPEAGDRAKLDLVVFLITEGRLLQATNDLAGALVSLEEAVRIGTELTRTKDARGARLALARCYGTIGSIYIDSSRADDAVKAEVRAAEIVQKLVDDDPRDLVAKNVLANSFLSQGYALALYLKRFPEGLQAFELARGIEKEIFAADPERLEYGRVLSEIDSLLGIHLLQRGETDRAFAVLSEGRETIEKVAAAEPNVTLFQTIRAEVLGNLSFVHAKKGDLPKAIDAQRRSCDIIAKLFEADRGDAQLRRGLGGGFNNIGDLELASGNVVAALASYVKAKDLIEPLVKAQPRVEYFELGLAFSLAGLGRTHARLGQVREAAAELRASCAIWHRLSSSTLESCYACAGDHAVLAGLSGRRESGVSASEAEAEAKRAIVDLRAAVVGGFRTIGEVRGDRDFKALEGRNDFESLLRELGFPAIPFAREPRSAGP